MLNKKNMLKQLNRLSKEVTSGMREDEKRFDKIARIKPEVHLEVRKFDHHEK